MHLTSAQLRSILSLVEQRKTLQREVDALEKQIIKLTKTKVRTNLAKSGKKSSLRIPVSPASHTSLSPKAGAHHGVMKEAVLNLLLDAGAQGLSIKEIAHELGLVRSRVQAWFGTTGRHVSGLEKIAVGRWRYLP